MKREDSQFELARAAGGNGKADVPRWPHHATHSICELEYRLLLAYDLGLLDYRKYKQIESLIFEDSTLGRKFAPR